MSTTIDQLREIHHAQPFRRFKLELADGNYLDVPHPECLSYFGKGRTIAVAVSDNVIKVIGLMLVASIEIDSVARHRRRKRK